MRACFLLGREDRVGVGKEREREREIPMTRGIKRVNLQNPLGATDVVI